MYEIEVSGEFSAAHALKLYDGSYEPRHGHLWKVSVWMRSQELDSMGVVYDFEDLKPKLKKILADYHGYFLNEHPDFSDEKLNPSTENVAKMIYQKLSAGIQVATARVVKVSVWETSDAVASFVA